MTAWGVFCSFSHYPGETNKKPSAPLRWFGKLQGVAFEGETNHGMATWGERGADFFFKTTLTSETFPMTFQLTCQMYLSGQFLWSTFSCTNLQLVWSHQSHVLLQKSLDRTFLWKFKLIDWFGLKFGDQTYLLEFHLRCPLFMSAGYIIDALCRFFLGFLGRIAEAGWSLLYEWPRQPCESAMAKKSSSALVHLSSRTMAHVLKIPSGVIMVKMRQTVRWCQLGWESVLTTP